jgi:uncharacterized membrane protein YphA (DoxX/SURF4 family)
MTRLMRRLAFAFIAFYTGFRYLFQWEKTLKETAISGVDHPKIVLGLLVFLLFLGGWSLLFKYKMKWGCLVLMIAILGSAFLFFPFWDKGGWITTLGFFAKCAICLGLLFMMRKVH